MTDGISKSQRGGNSAYLKMGAWYDQKTGHIHLTIPGTSWFHSTVANDPSSIRGNPNLYAKLARALKEAGVPGPDVDEREVAQV
ncbi:MULTISPECIES: hypothetical protein [unclassified Bradyrhizobium]|uniref:hypothetical protein n=1 Tax=unclassified Bradyrhizobium TaxID=2631580 RepID=UPI0028EB48EC|nr:MULTISPECIES: hypothetical protein [unclassified Bradyrhizobium]